MSQEPVILKFPDGGETTIRDIRIGDAATHGPLELPADVDLKMILAAWNEATDRLQHTHETLAAEVRRLSDELDVKNRELARKNRLADLGQMASHVAHEVRNSLVPMKLYLSLLRRRIDSDRGSLDVLDKVMAGFTALEATVGDLLHFSSQRDARRERVAVLGLIQELVKSLEPQLGAQSIRTSVDCAANLVASVDPDMLRRSLLNLVLNAVDALPAGGELVITACLTSAGMEIEVADSGPGVATPLAERLFEPFFTTKATGTGLGLAIVERIAAAHGGQVTVRNCPEGGAAFTLIFPQMYSALERAA
jgi:signal transduction histidine kinase